MSILVTNNTALKLWYEQHPMTGGHDCPICHREPGDCRLLPYEMLVSDARYEGNHRPALDRYSIPAGFDEALVTTRNFYPNSYMGFWVRKNGIWFHQTDHFVLEGNVAHVELWHDGAYPLEPTLESSNTLDAFRLKAIFDMGSHVGLEYIYEVILEGVHITVSRDEFIEQLKEAKLL